MPSLSESFGVEVEGNGGGDERPFVIDRQGGVAALVMADGAERDHRLLSRRDGGAGGGRALARSGQRIGRGVARRIEAGGARRRAGRGLAGRRLLRHRAARKIGGRASLGRAAGGRNIDFVEHGRALGVARIDLHDDVILVDRGEDGRDLPLAEGVIERVVDLRRRQAEARGGVAVDDQIGLQRLGLLVRGHVLEPSARDQRVGQLLRPFVKLADVFRGQGILILRRARPRAGAKILRRLENTGGRRAHGRVSAASRAITSSTLTSRWDSGLSAAKTVAVLVEPPPPPLPAPVKPTTVSTAGSSLAMRDHFRQLLH